jgi:hypothetical protein
MSDNFLRLIPEQPQFEPSHQASETALGLLKALMLNATAVNARRFKEIRFVDQGANFERVLCPHCNLEITSHWSRWMEDCSQSQFTQREFTLPCCNKESDLNDLAYHWPAGFAKFILEVENPNPAEWLRGEVQKSLELVLGCKIRQILAHY